MTINIHKEQTRVHSHTRRHGESTQTSNIKAAAILLATTFLLHLLILRSARPYRPAYLPACLPLSSIDHQVLLSFFFIEIIMSGKRAAGSSGHEEKANKKRKTNDNNEQNNKVSASRLFLTLKLTR